MFQKFTLLAISFFSFLPSLMVQPISEGEFREMITQFDDSINTCTQDSIAIYRDAIKKKQGSINNSIENLYGKVNRIKRL